MLIISGYIIHYMSRFHEQIEEKRQGMLMKNVRDSDNYSWFYFPSFLIRRIVYISIPMIINHKAFQIMSLITLNLVSLSIYAAYRPHRLRSVYNGELINEVFVLVLSHHLLCFTELVPSIDVHFHLAISYAMIVGILIIINLGYILCNILESFKKVYLKFKLK